MTSRPVDGVDIGRELTKQLLARGDRVAATLRRPDQLDDLAARYGERLWVRALDVTDTGQMGSLSGRRSKASGASTGLTKTLSAPTQRPGAGPRRLLTG